MSKKYVPEFEKKSTLESLKEFTIYLIIATILYAIGSFILNILIAPIRFLILSDRQKFEAKLEKARAKLRARELARMDYEFSENNPMVQYIRRFKTNIREYKDDPDNEKYLRWYNDLKRGVILDSRLLWAPEVYVHDENGKCHYNRDFLDYISWQLDLHRSGSLKSKILFLMTIRKYYPEFTPKLSVMDSEIADLYSRLKKDLERDSVHKEVIRAIESKGVSEEFARNLIEEAKEGDEENIIKSIETYKRCESLGFSEIMRDFCIKHNFSPDHMMAAAVNKILTVTRNEELVLLFINGVLTPEEVMDIGEKALYGVKSMKDYYERVNQEMKKVLRSKRKV